jgi:hypothetical protein
MMAYTEDSRPDAVPDNTTVAGPVRVVRATSFGGQLGNSETSVVWVSNTLNEFCVF